MKKNFGYDLLPDKQLGRKNDSCRPTQSEHQNLPQNGYPTNPYSSAQPLPPFQQYHPPQSPGFSYGHPTAPMYPSPVYPFQQSPYHAPQMYGGHPYGAFPMGSGPPSVHSERSARHDRNRDTPVTTLPRPSSRSSMDHGHDNRPDLNTTSETHHSAPTAHYSPNHYPSPHVSPSAYMHPSYDPTYQMYHWQQMYQEYMNNVYYPHMRRAHRSRYRPRDEYENSYRTSPAPSSVRDDESVYEDEIAAKSNKGRSTPRKFPSLHSIAKFSCNGTLVFTDCINGTTSHIYCSPQMALSHSHKSSLSVRPFLPGRYNKNEVCKVILERMKLIIQADAESRDYYLLLNYLLLLVKNNGFVDDLELCELFLDSSPNVTSPTSSEVLNGLDETVIAQSDSQIMDELRNMLVVGKQRECIDHAIENNLWGFAMRFSKLINPNLHEQVISKFDSKNFPPSDSFRTFISLKSKQTLPLSSMKDSWIDWRKHLAMILSNRDNNDSSYVSLLGDLLLSRRCISASHICFLINRVQFSSPIDKNPKLILIGCEKSANQIQYLEDHFHIYITILYEYVIRISQPAFYIKFLQKCKLTVAVDLLDIGDYESSLDYCESASIAVCCNPADFSVGFISRLLSLSILVSNKLKQNPSWLASLQYAFDNYSDLSTCTFEPIPSSVQDSSRNSRFENQLPTSFHPPELIRPSAQTPQPPVQNPVEIPSINPEMSGGHLEAPTKGFNPKHFQNGFAGENPAAPISDPPVSEQQLQQQFQFNSQGNSNDQYQYYTNGEYAQNHIAREPLLSTIDSEPTSPLQSAGYSQYGSGPVSPSGSISVQEAMERLSMSQNRRNTLSNVDNVAKEVNIPDPVYEPERPFQQSLDTSRMRMKAAEQSKRYRADSYGSSTFGEEDYPRVPKHQVGGSYMSINSAVSGNSHQQRIEGIVENSRTSSLADLVSDEDVVAVAPGTQPVVVESQFTAPPSVNEQPFKALPAPEKVGSRSRTSSRQTDDSKPPPPSQPESLPNPYARGGKMSGISRRSGYVDILGGPKTTAPSPPAIPTPQHMFEPLDNEGSIPPPPSQPASDFGDSYPSFFNPSDFKKPHQFNLLQPGASDELNEAV